MRAMPSSHQFCGLGRIEVTQHGVGADLPDHHIRMQVDDFGLQPFHHLGVSSPPLPRLMTVMSAVGYCRRNCAARRFG